MAPCIFENVITVGGGGGEHLMYVYTYNVLNKPEKLVRLLIYDNA